MGIEIERKFLVNDPSVLDGLTGLAYRQGYLLNEVSRTVRVRRAGDRGFLTIKGAASGATRPEYEYEIPVSDADQMLAMCRGVVIDKVRYRIPIDDVVFEVDRFEGANAERLTGCLHQCSVPYSAYGTATVPGQHHPVPGCLSGRGGLSNLPHREPLAGRVPLSRVRP